MSPQSATPAGSPRGPNRLRSALLFVVRPWRAPGATGQRLGLLLIVSLVWDLVLSADQQASGKQVIWTIVL
ncbi:MAG: hypothetical protein WBA31_04115, partial [Candidatus Dormiibacterota bacterium]